MSGKRARSERAAKKQGVLVATYEDFQNGLLDDLIDEKTLVINGSSISSEHRGEGFQIETPLSDPEEIIEMMGYVRTIAHFFAEIEKHGQEMLVDAIRYQTKNAIQKYTEGPSHKVNWVRLVELDSFLFMRWAWHKFHKNEKLERAYYAEWICFDSWLDDNLKGEAHEYHYEALYSEDSIQNARVYAAQGLVA